jgi:hypothetical protein
MLFFVLLGAIAPVPIFIGTNFCVFSFSFYAASNLAGRIRIKRSPRPPPRRAPPTKITFCALYIRKFELFLNLKGRAAAAAVQPPPYLEFTLSAVEGLGLRPRKLLKNAGSNRRNLKEISSKEKTQKF